VLSYDLSLITIHISDCRQFSDIHVSQGSVAAYFRRGGICFRCREPHGDSTLDHCFSPGPRLPSQLQGVTAVNRYQCRHSSVNRDMCEQLCMAVERSGLLPTTCRSFVKWPTYRGISSHCRVLWGMLRAVWLCVGRIGVPCKNGWTDREAFFTRVSQRRNRTKN